MKPILPRRLSGGQHTKKPSTQAAQADALLRLLVAFVLIVIFFPSCWRGSFTCK